VVTEDMTLEETPPRRLIIIVVEPGEDPEIETDPPASFALWEIQGALQRALEIAEEDDFAIQNAPDEEEE
jgi:hypothetical protein